MSVTKALAGAARMGRVRWDRLLLVLNGAFAAGNFDLISYLKEIPNSRMRREVRILAWYLQLVAVQGSLEVTQKPLAKQLRASPEVPAFP